MRKNDIHLRVAFDSNYEVISNGRLTAKKARVRQYNNMEL
jgi:hypothetical protein